MQRVQEKIFALIKWSFQICDRLLKILYYKNLLWLISLQKQFLRQLSDKVLYHNNIVTEAGLYEVWYQIVPHFNSSIFYAVRKSGHLIYTIFRLFLLFYLQQLIVRLFLTNTVRMSCKNQNFKAIVNTEVQPSPKHICL